jgi:RNA polymerase sigma-70 factor, ECF subfamily
MTDDARASRAEAAEAMWRSLHAGLRRGLRARGASDDVIDDVLQETFLRLHERVDELEQVRRVDHWLWRVAQNALIDRARRERTRTAEPIDDGATAAPADPADANWNHEVERWLREYIDELPPAYRDAVRLHEVEGLEQREVGERLGLSLSGAKSRIQRGRAALRRLLLECCHLEFDRRGNVVAVQRRACCDGHEPAPS